MSSVDGRRSGFTLLEIVVVLGILFILAGMSIPWLRNIQIERELDLAAQEIHFALYRAQSLARGGEVGLGWGVLIRDGVLFAGKSYGNRDVNFDERYSISPNITVLSGPNEVVFNQVYGVPSATGTILLQAINGSKRAIAIPPGFGPKPPKAPPVRVRIVFDRVKNNGKGNATSTVYLGEDPTPIPNDTWFWLRRDGQILLDPGMTLDAPGLGLQRGPGWIRVREWAGLDTGGKEVIDARIIFDGATVDHVENGADLMEMETPFDGVINDGVGGDEVIVDPGGTTVFFYARETNYGDEAIVYWNAPDAPDFP